MICRSCPNESGIQIIGPCSSGVRQSFRWCRSADWRTCRSSGACRSAIDIHEGPAVSRVRMSVGSVIVVLFGLPLWLVLGFLFVLGTVIGSFLNVCIHRIPLHDDLWKSLKGISHPPS